MGIQGLLPFLSTYKKEISFAELEGKVCRIDAYGWLYKGVYCCAYELVTGTETTQHIDFVIRRLQMLKDKGVQPVLVFDGRSVPFDEERCRVQSQTEKTRNQSGGSQTDG